MCSSDLASRLASSVITGIGFLGAGIIIKASHQQVKGLTTAAGLWATGIIGIAVGSGYCELGLLGTAMVLLTETWLGLLGKNIRPQPEYTMELMYDEKTSLDQVLRLCKDSRMAIVNLKIHTLGADDDARYAAEVFLRGNVDRETLLGKVRRMPGIVSAIAE